MIKRIFISIFIVFSIFFITACEKSKDFQVPKLTGRVVDTTKTLSDKQKKEIENTIIQFEKNTGGQFAVCIVPTISDESIESASIKVAEAWKIGHKDKDNGIIFFLTMKEKEFRIEVGYGFEEKITNGIAGEIGRNTIPFFKKQEWEQGIIFIINECNAVITNQKTITQSATQEEQNLDKGTLKIIIITFVILVIIIATFFDDNTHFHGHYYSGGSSFRGGSSYKGGGGSFGGGGFSGKF